MVQEAREPGRVLIFHQESYGFCLLSDNLSGQLVLAWVLMTYFLFGRLGFCL